MAQPLQRRLRAVLLARASVLACLLGAGHSFPVFFTANGSAVVTSAYGSDVVLQPDGPGAVVTRALLQANAGVQLNATLLNEAVLNGLLSLAQAQSATLAQLVAAAGAPVSSATTYTLTTCGMIGPYGPSLPLCRDAYAPAAWAADDTLYGFGAPTGGTVLNWQRLTLPQGGRYRISVAGGSAVLNTPVFCRGALVQTVVYLPANVVLYAMVGGQSRGNFGAGGSFLLFANGTVLLVAGGSGAGSGSVSTGPQGSLCDASFTTSGQPSAPGGAVSSDGNGGAGECGGSGLYGQGSTSTAALAGGYGGVIGTGTDGWGGFGGGSGPAFVSTNYGPVGLYCGGGGYSGGATSTYILSNGYLQSGGSSNGGGGGSFCGTSECDFGFNVPDTPGYVTLTLLSTT